MWRQPGSRWKARCGGSSGKNYGRPAEGRHELPAATSEHKGHLSFITGQSPYLLLVRAFQGAASIDSQPLTEATTSNIVAPHNAGLRKSPTSSGAQDVRVGSFPSVRLRSRRRNAGGREITERWNRLGLAGGRASISASHRL